MGFWSNWWDEVRLAAWTRDNPRSSSDDSEEAREKIIRKARKKIASAFHTGIKDCCSKTIEGLKARGFVMDNAVTLIQPAKSKTFARTLPKVVMDIPKIDADEIEKRLRTPANNYWQKFYRGHCASITKQEQELNKEIEQLNELIRYWKNKAAYAPSKTKGRK